MTPRRLIFIGLDGVGLDLARGLAAEGVMPNLGRLMDTGAAWATASPLPDVSPVCWTTMFSGRGPGEHGIYGFGHPRRGRYGIEPVDSSMVAAPRLWDDLCRRGGRAAVLGVPLTFPASPLDGVMISGFVCPDLAAGVYPASLLPRLEAAGYRPEAELELGRHDPAALLADVAQALQTRLDVFGSIFSDEAWDLYAAVITDTDRVNHFAWPALCDPGHPLARAARRVYALADEFIGRIWRGAADELEAGRARLVVAADHAFGPIRSEVYLNPWLVEQGLLQMEGAPPNETILPGSAALALDPGRIHLHWAGRFPHGRLMPGPHAEDLARRIAEGLSALRFRLVERTGRGVEVSAAVPIARVHRAAELYHGPLADEAPDLVAEAAPGFSLRAGADRPSVFGLSHLSGTHRPHGALAAAYPAPAVTPRGVQSLGRWLFRGLDPHGRFAPTGEIALH